VVTDALKSLDESSTAVRRARAFTGRGLLIASEIALALALLIAAGLTMRSLAFLLGTRAGFDARNVISMRVSLPEGRYAGPDSAIAFFDQLLARVRVIPGVQAASIGNCLPLAGGCNGTIIMLKDRPAAPRGQEPDVGVHWITPGWQQTIGVTLLRGRELTPQDRKGTPKVVLINETAAKRFWPNEDPVGKIVGIGQGGFGDGAEVIGVVSDVRFGRIDQLPQPDVFISYLQSQRRGGTLFIRTSLPASSMIGAVRRELRALDSTLPLYDIRTMAERIGDAVARPKFSAILLTVFAGLALALAAVGIYGVMAFDVTQRTREIGIRMALGAARRDVLGLILRQGIVVATLGIAGGLAIAWGTSRALAGLLYGVKATDPTTFVLLSIAIALIAVVATIIPAIRATRVSPLVAIRR
jgi:predicted permease